MCLSELYSQMPSEQPKPSLWLFNIHRCMNCERCISQANHSYYTLYGVTKCDSAKWPWFMQLLMLKNNGMDSDSLFLTFEYGYLASLLPIQYHPSLFLPSPHYLLASSRTPPVCTTSRGSWRCLRKLSVSGHFSSATPSWISASRGMKRVSSSTQRSWRRWVLSSSPEIVKVYWAQKTGREWCNRKLSYCFPSIDSGDHRGWFEACPRDLFGTRRQSGRGIQEPGVTATPCCWKTPFQVGPESLCCGTSPPGCKDHTCVVCVLLALFYFATCFLSHPKITVSL